MEEREEGDNGVPIENHLEADDSNGSLMGGNLTKLGAARVPYPIYVLAAPLHPAYPRTLRVLSVPVPVRAVHRQCQCQPRQAPDISQGAGVSTLHAGISEDSAVKGLIKYVTAIVALYFPCRSRPSGYPGRGRR
jgi:hypothetical protein